MSTQVVFCPRCNRQVYLTSTRAPGHLGQANLAEDGTELVCLDYHETCDGGKCAVTGEPEIVMAVRLARSGLRETPWPAVRMVCPACGEARELEVLDKEHGYCPVCGSTVAWTRPGDANPV